MGESDRLPHQIRPFQLLRRVMDRLGLMDAHHLDGCRIVADSDMFRNNSLLILHGCEAVVAQNSRWWLERGFKG
jgi:hypothetical protein